MFISHVSCAVLESAACDFTFRLDEKYAKSMFVSQCCNLFEFSAGVVKRFVSCVAICQRAQTVPGGPCYAPFRRELQGFMARWELAVPAGPAWCCVFSVCVCNGARATGKSCIRMHVAGAVCLYVAARMRAARAVGCSAVTVPVREQGAVGSRRRSVLETRSRVAQ
jgi:hypothetical protein